MTKRGKKPINSQLLDPKFQKEQLGQSLRAYIESGNFKDLLETMEQIIKARTTVSEFAIQIGINRVQLVRILHGRTQAPSLITVGKILAGLGYCLDVIPA